jgi:hypothetical protein
MNVNMTIYNDIKNKVISTWWQRLRKTVHGMLMRETVRGTLLGQTVQGMFQRETVRGTLLGKIVQYTLRIPGFKIAYR